MRMFLFKMVLVRLSDPSAVRLSESRCWRTAFSLSVFRSFVALKLFLADVQFVEFWKNVVLISLE